MLCKQFLWTHLGYHSDGLVSKLDRVSVSTLQLHQRETIHTSLTVVGDVLTDMGVLQSQEPQGDIALWILKLKGDKDGLLELGMLKHTIFVHILANTYLPASLRSPFMQTVWYYMMLGIVYLAVVLAGRKAGLCSTAEHPHCILGRALVGINPVVA